MNEVVTVNFRGTEIYGLKSGELVYVALKPIVEAIGLSWGSQYNRVKRDPILSKGVFILKMPFGEGGPQDYVCLNLKRLNGWLFTINSNQIKDAGVRERVLVFQEECYDVLYDHFFGSHMPDVRESAREAESLSLRLVSEARQIWGDRVAAQVWEKRGLTKVPAMDEVFWQLSLPLDNRQSA